MARDLQEVRREILEMHQRVQEENYYELFGVDREADTAKIGAKFRELARKWHVDRFSNYDLGPDKQKVQDIFSTINAAHKTLISEDKRTEYDMEIHDGPTIGEILEAESYFRRGKTMLGAGSYKGAHEAFKAAYEMKDDELEYEAHFLYTEYLMLPKNEEGIVKQKGRAKEIFDKLDHILAALPESDWLLTFMGVVAMGRDREVEAESLFTEALMANSRNTDARRQLRLIRSRRKKSNKKGFFAKLFGK